MEGKVSRRRLLTPPSTAVSIAEAAQPGATPAGNACLPQRGYIIDVTPAHQSDEAQALLSLIIFPEVEARRQRFIEAAALIRRGNVSKTRYAAAWRTVWTADRILHLQRIPAGEIYRRVLLQGYGIRALSGALAERLNRLTADERRRKNGLRWTRDKVIQGVLTPSKPVVHLTMALSNFFARWPERNRQVMSLIVEPAWLEHVVEEAENLRAEGAALEWASFRPEAMFVVVTEAMVARRRDELAGPLNTR